MENNYEGTLLSLVEPRGFWEDHKKAFLFWDGEKPLSYTSQMSYGSLNEKISKFALFLRSLGVFAGERVGIMLPNSPQFPIAYFGALKIGAVAVLINPLYDADPKTLLAILKDSGVKIIVAWDLFFESIYKLKDKARLKNLILTCPADALPYIKAKIYNFTLKKKTEYNDAREYDGFTVNFSKFNRFAPGAIDHVIKPNDLAVILYTSGTSGEPKGVVHSHGSLLSNAKSCEKYVMKIGMKNGKEIFLAAAPYFHIMGITAMLHLPLLIRAKIVLLPKPQEIRKLFDAIMITRATGFVGFPKLYEAMARKMKNEKEKYDLSSLKYCISGAAKLSPETRDKFESLWGGKILVGYGLTETGITHAQTSAKEGRAGFVFDGVEEKLLSADENNIGELLVRGKSVMLCYWDKYKETMEILDFEGWLHTGDMATKDGNGEIIILGRINDDFVKGSHGEKISLGVAEKALLDHRLVADAAVVAIPKPKDNYLLKAFVVLNDSAHITEPEITESLFARLKTVPSSHRPDEIAYLKEIPKNPMGKVLKKILRAST